MDTIMRLLADPAEAFAQYGWYLVGAAVVYLASNEASWLTGQTIGLNGGATTS